MDPLREVFGGMLPVAIAVEKPTPFTYGGLGVLLPLVIGVIGLVPH
jgi:hypothetical protein